jgi:hypothetical protein
MPKKRHRPAHKLSKGISRPISEGSQSSGKWEGSAANAYASIFMLKPGVRQPGFTECPPDDDKRKEIRTRLDRRKPHD